MELLNYYSELHNNQTYAHILSQLDEWLRNFICQPHPELGRSGDVCPYVDAALRQEYLRLSYKDLPNDPNIDKRAVLSKFLLSAGDEFKKHTSSQEGTLDCLIVMILGLSMHEWRYVMDGAYRDVKSHILRKKLMVGCFYPFYNRPSLRNPNFFPMRCPVPIFAFRHMLRSDRPSLQESELYISIYESFYPPD